MKQRLRLRRVLLLTIILPFLSKAQPPVNGQPITIGYQTTTTLIFPAAIEAADYGSTGVLVQPFKKASNLLKVKAARKNFIPTNLTVVTSDQMLYCIPVTYQACPEQLVYQYTDSTATAGKAYDLQSETLTPRQIETTAGALSAAAPRHGGPRVKRYRMDMRFLGVRLHKNGLFFAFRIRNDSPLPFVFHITRFYTHDRTKARRSSYGEQGIKPRYVYSSTGKQIPGKSTTVLVIAFDLFTIADHKYFTIELAEKNGDRQLRMNVRGKKILQASPW